MAAKSKGGPKHKITQKLIDNAYKWGSVGLIKREFIKFMPFTEQRYYDYQKIALKHKDTPAAERKQLKDVEQKAIELFESYQLGRQRYIEKSLTEFSEAEIRIKWRLFERSVPSYQLKKLVDMEDLDVQLRREFGDKKTEAVLDILLSETFDYEEDEKVD